MQIRTIRLNTNTVHPVNRSTCPPSEYAASPNNVAQRNAPWRHVEPRPAMLAALAKVNRYIATPTVAKHRLFTWLDRRICPDHQLIAVTREDDVTFGILHSRFHEAWSLGRGTWLGVGNDPRYTPTTTFETFPSRRGNPVHAQHDRPTRVKADSSTATCIRFAATSATGRLLPLATS